MAERSVRKALPRTEILWKTETTDAGAVFYTTSDTHRTKYSLWKQVDDGVRLVTTGKTPEKFVKYTNK